ncbi:FxSxx-COOH cyclophane-containing RiPP peptide [Nonomuraea sp. SBT364]|uniref:FxSxx-COOH cyclophane-containing RiPP peptide n=1 Tax=Nonomuraea sp. SBT364 TaxID=1580530 RepID=UPI000ADCE6B8|nr:FxSxx-COOH cyclophane-containing RiPP peptide [Nonomuraea sp. SBT364]
MEDTNGTGLIDVGDIDLEDLKRLQNPALTRAWQRCADDGGGTVAGFQSAV